MQLVRVPSVLCLRRPRAVRAPARADRSGRRVCVQREFVARCFSLRSVNLPISASLVKQRSTRTSGYPACEAGREVLSRLLGVESTHDTRVRTCWSADVIHFGKRPCALLPYIDRNQPTNHPTKPTRPSFSLFINKPINHMEGCRISPHLGFWVFIRNPFLGENRPKSRDRDAADERFDARCPPATTCSTRR